MTGRAVACGRLAPERPDGVVNPDPDPERRILADAEAQQDDPGPAPCRPRLAVGSSRCQCARCKRFFGGVVTFDLHQVLTRTGDVVCLGDDALSRKGLRLVNGWWVRFYTGPGPDQAVDRGRGR